MTDPVAEPLSLPDGYGSPARRLAWDDVRSRLESAHHAWLATTRPDGRPHVVPVDGLWLDDRWWFGGSAETVHQRNLEANASVVLHLEDAAAAVVVEGVAEHVRPDDTLARRLAGLSAEKYGYAPDPGAYVEAGVWRMTPVRVLAWTAFPTDATRFRFTTPPAPATSPTASARPPAP